MDQSDIARALDAIAAKWEVKRSEFWTAKEQFDTDARDAAQGGDDRSEQRYTAASAKYERLAAVAKEASNDAYELAARVRGLV